MESRSECPASREAWQRADMLMDHLEERIECEEEWDWYQRKIVDFLRRYQEQKSKYHKPILIMQLRMYYVEDIPGSRFYCTTSMTVS